MNEFDSSAIIRDLEMLLDQLYYWAKRAQESRSASDDDGLVGRMLEVATANLEAFVTTLLDCFRPLELVPIRVPTSDLVSAIAMRARGELGAASVTVSGEANEIVSADVAQLTRAMFGILRRLHPCGRSLHLAVARAERGGRRGIEIALRTGPEARAGAPRHGRTRVGARRARRRAARGRGAGACGAPRPGDHALPARG